MAEWTYSDDYTLLPNLYVRSKFLDGVFKWYQIYPCDGYVLRIPTNDSYQIDENGDYVLDENGNTILETPYRTSGGAMVVKDYDWNKNPNQYTAEKFNKNMTIY